MLFDLEDFKNFGIIGTSSLAPEQICWYFNHTDSKSTMNMYVKAVKEYGLAALNFSGSSEESNVIESKIIDFLESYVEFGPAYRQFWNALVSLPLQSGGAMSEGDSFHIANADINDMNPAFISYPMGSYDPYSKTVAFKAEGNQDLIDQYGPQMSSNFTAYSYTILTQAIYDAYVVAIKNLQLKAKELLMLGEGGIDLAEYVAPPIPAWESYPELSGYVRGTNSVTIKDAVVRLIDADGVNHDIITDSNGYYKFSKEMFYNEIAFDHNAESSVNMFLLEHKSGSTASMYDTTDILQNSFFGAENDRGLQWPVAVKMGKQFRKNIKIEILPDYRSYPSVKGQVLDQDGNPVQNALVMLQYKGAQFFGDSGNGLIGSKYISMSQQVRYSSKYTVFGEEKSLLTDADGNYEYPSQMIGEWFNNEFLKQYGVYPSSQYGYPLPLNYNPNSQITGVTFDHDFYMNPQSGFGDNISGWPKIQGVKQSDGKIVMAGRSTSYNGESVSKVFRINADGTLDTSFASISLDYSINWGNPGYITSIDVQSDDKIIIAGAFDSVNGTPAFCVARLNADGTLDTTFSDSVLSQIGADIEYYRNRYGSNPNVNCIKVQPDDKILVGGFFYLESTNVYGLVRLNSDGTLDETFYNGLSLPNANTGENYPGVFGGLSEDPRVITLQPDGKILIGGSQWMSWEVTDWSSIYDSSGNFIPSDARSWALLRLNADGTLDTTFSVGDSFVNSSYGDYPYGHITAIAVDENGKILAGGDFTKFGEQEAKLIARLNADGTLDTTFSSPASHINSTGTFKAETILLKSGKILVGGYFNYASDDVKGGLLVLNQDGTMAHNGYRNESIDLGHQTIPKATSLAGYMSFVCNGESNPGVESLIDIGGDKILAFGKFTHFEEKSSPSDSWFAVDANGIAMLKFGQIDIYAPNLLNSSMSPDQVSLSVPALPMPNGYYQLTANDVAAFLNPYTQDPGGEVYFPEMNNSSYDGYNNVFKGTTGSMIYDYNNWFNSRFTYAYNDRNEKYIRTLLPGENTLNVREYLVDAEHGAELLKLGRYPGSGAIQDLYVRTTTGYATIRFPDGTWQVFGAGDTYSEISINYDTSAFDNVPSSQYNTKQVFHVYSSEGNHGASEGKIKSIRMNGPWNGSCRLFIEESSLTNHTEIESIEIDGGVANYIDVTGLTTLKSLKVVNYWTDLWILAGVETLTGLDKLYVDGTITSRVTRSATEFVYEPNDAYWKKNGNNDYPLLYAGEQVENVIKLGGKYYLIGSALGSMTMQSIASIGANYGGFDGYVGTHQSSKVIRVNSDMTIDDTFALGQYAFTDQYGSPASVNGSALQGDKILLVGNFDLFNGSPVKKMIRMNQDGTKDSSFSFTLDSDSLYKIKVLPDSTILVSGNNIVYNYESYALVKLSANGSFLAGFANTSANQFSAFADGKILTVSNGSLARFNADGTPDSSFNVDSNGLATYYDAYNDNVVVADDGKFYAAFGYNYDFNEQNSPLYRLRFARFNADGTLDTEFNNNLRKFFTPLNEGGYNYNADGNVYLIQPLSNGRVLFKPDGWGSFDNGEGFTSTALILDAEGNMTQELWYRYGYLWGILEEDDSIIVYGNTNGGIGYGQGIDKGAGSFAKLDRVGKPTWNFDFPQNNYSMTNYQQPIWGPNGYELSHMTTGSISYNSKGDLDYSGMHALQKLDGPASLRQWEGRTINLTGLTSLTDLRIVSNSGLDVPLITGSTSYSNLENVELMSVPTATLTRMMVGTSSQQIKKLVFTHNQWEIVGPSFESIGDISAFTSLNELSINGHFSMTQAPDLSANTQLTSLSLTWLNSLTQSPDLSANTQLTSLSLTGMLSMAEFPDLSANTQLTSLYVNLMPSLAQAPDLSANTLLNHIEWYAVSVDVSGMFEQLVANGQENGSMLMGPVTLSSQALANKNILASRGWYVYTWS